MFVSLGAALVLVLSRAAVACENQTVRDAAFSQPRNVHHLYVMANGDDPVGRRVCERMGTWLDTAGKGLNVKTVRIAADEPGIDWTTFGLPSAPPSLPVVALIGKAAAERRYFVIDHWEPAPTEDELTLLCDSPARQALRRELGRRLAVLLHIPSDGSDKARVERVLASTVESWSKREPLGVITLRLDRSDARERLLLSFAGATRTTEDWVAVVFGRGKFMSALVGTEITADNLNLGLETLIGSCTCTRSPATLGVDVPMLWDASLDADVVPLRSADDANSVDPNAALTAGHHSHLPSGLVASRTVWTFGLLALAVGVAAFVLVLRGRRGEGAV